MHRPAVDPYACMPPLTSPLPFAAVVCRPVSPAPLLSCPVVQAWHRGVGRAATPAPGSIALQLFRASPMLAVWLATSPDWRLSAHRDLEIPANVRGRWATPLTFASAASRSSLLTLSRGAIVRKKQSRDQYSWTVRASGIAGRAFSPLAVAGVASSARWAVAAAYARTLLPALSLQTTSRARLCVNSRVCALLLL